MTKFVKFPSIEKFSDVNAMVNRAFEIDVKPTVTYRGKVKLHGTCAGIRVDSDGTVTALKRSNICTIDDDNAGFAKWVESIKEFLTPCVLHESAITDYGMVNTGIRHQASYIIYGEWAGPGVQKTVAVSQIEKKSFFPFAVYWMDVEDWYYDANEPEPKTKIVHNLGESYWNFDPEHIYLLTQKLPDTYVLPWSTPEFVVDMRLQSSKERFTQDISVLVNECDRSDPFIKEMFGIDGIGEGFVFYPVDTWLTKPEYKKYRTDYLFKAKGESHSNSKVSKFKAFVTVDPVIASGSNTFADQFVTEARLNQGLVEACGGNAVMKNLGPFMAWLGADVKKESLNELEASGLEWKNVAKIVNNRAKDWFVTEIEKGLTDAY